MNTPSTHSEQKCMYCDGNHFYNHCIIFIILSILLLSLLISASVYGDSKIKHDKYIETQCYIYNTEIQQKEGMACSAQTCSYYTDYKPCVYVQFYTTNNLLIDQKVCLDTENSLNDAQNSMYELSGQNPINTTIECSYYKTQVNDVSFEIHEINQSALLATYVLLISIGILLVYWIISFVIIIIYNKHRPPSYSR